MNTKFLAVIAFIILGLGGLFLITRDKSSTNNGTTGNNNTTKTSSHVIGKGTDKVTLVEYGDFQCPACGAYYPLLKEVKSKYTDRITFQFRNYPLTQIHPNAFAAARAAEAASLQNKFWEMHDILYEQQTSWAGLANPSRAFDAYAQQLSLNLEKFRTDYASIQVNDIINADIKAGQAYRITGTPTFVINGAKIEDSPRDLEGFSKLIDAEIAKQK